MKIKLIKDHTTGKAGDVVAVTDALGNYMIRCNVGIEYVEPKADKPKAKAKPKNKKTQKLKDHLEYDDHDHN